MLSEQLSLEAVRRPDTPAEGVGVIVDCAAEWRVPQFTAGLTPQWCASHSRGSRSWGRKVRQELWQGVLFNGGLAATWETVFLSPFLKDCLWHFTEVYQCQHWLRLLNVSVSPLMAFQHLKGFQHVNPVSVWVGLKHL